MPLDFKEDIGGSGSGAWVADAHTGIGTQFTFVGVTWDVSGLTDPPPDDVLDTIRYNSGASFLYTKGGFAPGASVAVKIWTAANNAAVSQYSVTCQETENSVVVTPVTSGVVAQEWAVAAQADGSGVVSLLFEKISVQFFLNAIRLTEQVVDNTAPVIDTFGATAISQTQINLAWTAHDEGGGSVASFDLEWSATGNNLQAASGTSGWTNILSAQNQNSYNNTSLTANTQRFYRIRVRDNAGTPNVSAWSAVNATTWNIAPSFTTAAPLGNVNVDEQTDFPIVTANGNGTRVVAVQPSETLPAGVTLVGTNGHTIRINRSAADAINILLRVTDANGQFANRTFTATLVDPNALPAAVTDNFEEFQLGTIFNIVQDDLDMPVLSANFGAGYKPTGVLTGPASGLRTWTISSDLIPDLEQYSVEYDTLEDSDLTATRFRYFYEFYRRHTSLGIKPFYFWDEGDERFYLASFVETRLSLQRLTGKLRAGGVTIEQRRVKMEGITFNADDGSLVTGA